MGKDKKHWWRKNGTLNKYNAVMIYNTLIH